MHREEIRHAVDAVVCSGWYLQGASVKLFEEQYAEYIGTRHCVSCGNGLDALRLMLRGYIELGKLKEGDEVIVPANTYIATILAITDCRLVPVLVEPNIDTLQIDDSLIEQYISERTRAVMIVHLYGRCAMTERIADICRRHNLLLFEDNAQAHGCTFQGRHTGSLGNAAAHSFYPGKNLGALGDAGAVTTDDDELAAIVRAIANYGSAKKYVFDYQGLNSRMDEIHAAVLSVKLKYLDEDNNRRKQIAHYYINNINNPEVRMMKEDDTDNVRHIFPILSLHRDTLQQHLLGEGVATMIHYPIPPHRQKCYPQFAHLQLPITVEWVAKAVNVCSR